jgi:hypothetical protein
VLLHALVRHRADRHQAVLESQLDVAGAAKVLRYLTGQRRDHFAVPLAREASPRAEVEELVGVLPLVPRFGHVRLQVLDLRRQAAAPLGQHRRRGQLPEVQLVDDRQHEDLERGDVQQRSVRGDAQPVPVGRDLEELHLEAEDAEPLDEVLLHIGARTEQRDVVLGEAQAAQVLDLLAHAIDQLAQRHLRRVAADELRHPGGFRVVVQHHLPHRELVEVGVEQRADRRLEGLGHGLSDRGSHQTTTRRVARPTGASMRSSRARRPAPAATQRGARTAFVSSITSLRRLLP